MQGPNLRLSLHDACGKGRQNNRTGNITEENLTYINAVK